MRTVLVVATSLCAPVLGGLVCLATARGQARRALWLVVLVGCAAATAGSAARGAGTVTVVGALTGYLVVRSLLRRGRPGGGGGGGGGGGRPAPPPGPRPSFGRQPAVRRRRTPRPAHPRGARRPAGARPGPRP